MKSVREAEVSGKRVLVRCDFNVPLDEQGRIEDDSRIQEALPTIRLLLSKQARVILLSHLDEPEGKVVEALSLKSIAKHLEKLLGMPILHASDCIGAEAKEKARSLLAGEILLLENLRFHPQEEASDTAFARELSSLGDLYVNEAFSASHRDHASLVGIPRLLSSFAGLLLEKEVMALEKIIKQPEHPLVVLIGGAKAESKGDFIDAISETADAILLGNLIANTLSSKQWKYPNKIIKPQDGIPGHGKEFDLGPLTITMFSDHIKKAQTIFWAGPLGKIEEEAYQKGTLAIAQAMSEGKAYSVAGGGDLSSFLRKKNLREKFSYVSTGGGAMLAFLAKEKLPGLEALGYYSYGK